MNTMAFLPSQIICLEHEYEALYAESIQILEEREQVWARPIVLATLPTAFHSHYRHPHLTHAMHSGDYSAKGYGAASIQAVPWLHEATLFDLRLGSDLLWPRDEFRPALDTEIIPIVTQLGEPKHTVEGDRQANHAVLQQFIRNAWSACAPRQHSQSSD